MSGPNDGLARFELDLRIEAEPLAGRLRLPAGGESWDFVGWLSLTAAIEQGVEAANARREDDLESGN
ncbi:MAG: hypothetical protein ACRDQF_09040 [Thermocrispum sp.]